MSLRLGVIGFSEGNGHPFSFSAIVNGYDDAAFAAAGWPAIHAYLRARAPEEFSFSGVRVTHAWTPDPGLTQRLCAACRIAHAAPAPDAMLGAVDAVLVLRDDPDSHLPLARPFREAGVPVFIDKPLTVDAGELAWFEPHLRAGRLMSCAGLRFATELDPLRGRLAAELGRIKLIRAVVLNDWQRYGIHMLEAGLGLVPARPVALRRLPAAHESVAITLDDGGLFTIDALGPAPKTFNLALFGDAGRASFELADNFGAFRRVLAAFIGQVRSGIPAIPPDDVVAVIRALIAGRTAPADGRAIRLAPAVALERASSLLQPVA